MEARAVENDGINLGVNVPKAKNNVVWNIYHMLAYAFDFYKDATEARVDGEDFENIHELLATLLAAGVRKLVLRGLSANYLPIIEKTGRIRGKIDISQSIKERAFDSGKVICQYDEYSIDIALNQIIKASMLLLLRSGNIAKTDVRKKLWELVPFFATVMEVEPTAIRWDLLVYHGNNAHYKMLINICHLIIRGLIVRERPDMDGKYKLFLIEDSQKMSQLFERFVCAYFKKHAPEVFFGGQKEIKWADDDNPPPTRMSADIILRHNKNVVIIDTKYYESGAMFKNAYYGNTTFHSANLYQIFSYVTNYAHRHQDQTVSGMLLYAKMPHEKDEELRTAFAPLGNRIEIRSLDLSLGWDRIVEQLNVIIENVKK